MLSVSLEEQKQQDGLDLMKAEAHRRPRMMELENQFDRDNDHGTFDQRFIPAAKQIDDEAASLIRNPQMREKFKYKTTLETTQSRDRVLTKGTRLAKQQRFVETDESVSGILGGYPNASEEQKAQALAEAEAAIEVGKQTGLLDYEHAHRLKQKHIYGNGGALYREAEARLWDDPYGVLSDLNAAGRVRQPVSGLSPQGEAAIKESEGYSPTAKWDKRQHSSGWGTKAQEGETITPQEAQRRFVNETGRVSDWVGKNVKVTLSQSQHDALVSFGFNLGEGAIEKILPDINAGNFERAAERMLSFNKAKDDTTGRMVVEPGLTKRRQREAAMFRSGGIDQGVSGEIPAGDPEPGSRIEEGQALADPGEQAPSLPDMRSPSAERYARMAPEARAALMTRARTALSAVTQQEIGDDIERIRRTGEPQRDGQGRTAYDRAARILSPNQLSKVKIALDEASMEYRALAPLRELSEEEAADHLTRIAPDEKAPDDSYKSAARVLTKAERTWKKIAEHRQKDPAGAVSGGVIPGTPGGVTVGPDGQMTMQQGDTELPIKPAREVQAAYEMVTNRTKEVSLGVDRDGDLVVQSASGSPMPAQKAWDTVFKARLAAQERLGLPEWQRKPITQREAAKLLDMPADTLLSDGEYTKRLKVAADRAEQIYGPTWGRRAFEAAIALQVKSKEHREEAAGVVSRMVRGESVTRREIDRLGALDEIDRVGRIFESSPTPQDAERPLISPMSRPRAAAEYGLVEAGEKANRKPTPELKEWIIRNPDRWQRFDMEFGRGAAAEILKGKKK